MNVKALCVREHGELDVLHWAGVADPEPRPGEAVVRVRACGLSRLDIWVRRG